MVKRTWRESGIFLLSHLSPLISVNQVYISCQFTCDLTELHNPVVHVVYIFMTKKPVMNCNCVNKHLSIYLSIYVLQPVPRSMMGRDYCLL